MEIQKIFTDMEGEEVLYSVLMSEEEIQFFSEIQREFNSPAQKALRRKVELDYVNKHFPEAASKLGGTDGMNNLLKKSQKVTRIDPNSFNFARVGVTEGVADAMNSSQGLLSSARREISRPNRTGKNFNSAINWKAAFGPGSGKRYYKGLIMEKALKHL